MQAQEFTSFQCWYPDRIGQVINKEAASVNKAVFLATHTPMDNLIYEKEPYVIADTGEAGLLGELQRCNHEDRHAFVVVQGIPGTGKSHLIRWLAERYEAEEGHRGSVLFIARAQCSLRGTIDQIIKSGMFDDRVMREQLDKLQGATAALSRNALAQTILYQLHIATTEVQQPAMPAWMEKRRGLERFLLDDSVRTELLKANGPIDRLVRFLVQGSNSGIRGDEMPGFEARDFEFRASTLKEIGEGYSEAVHFATRLQGDEEIERREELSRYLNQLIRYAVGHATSLTNDDLKQVFNDLRRYLRQQDRHLALFIEDVTAFTGIDLGLIDVLATQHTGEANQEFCRLTSVIGITDNYFSDNFPENLKDRVTHRITLNAKGETHSEAGILANEQATADMSARYLNTMRLPQEDLDIWQANGGKPEHLPNACDVCEFKTVCHATFGFKEVQIEQSHTLHIGLYPFNERAIWNLYQHINTSTSKRTPRSLLNNVLSYVLQSHGQKIKQGDFPPPIAVLGGGFTTFSLKKPLQRGLINDQGKHDARRIESLILVWGDGTVDAVRRDASDTVGTLSEGVFKAFTIHFIVGEPTQISSPAKNYTGGIDSAISTNTTVLLHSSSSRTIPLEEYAGSATTQIRENKYTDDISSWLNGNKLRYYEDYSDLLSPFIRSSIDWELHEVSSLLVDELFKGRRRIYIEDQTGKANSAYYLSFARSSELAAVLQAVIELKENALSLPADVVSGHLSNMSLWLHQQEETIVNFVRQPNYESKNILPLKKMLTLNCLLLSCLQGSLTSTYMSTQELFLQLISTSAIAKESSWQESISAAHAIHSSAWYDLMKNIGPTSAERQYKTLLKVLNCAQGGSNEVRFVDAASALTILSEFTQSDWQLQSSGLVGTSAVTYWAETTSTYEKLFTYFLEALRADCASIQAMIQRFDNLLGTSTSKEVFQAIKSFVEKMTTSNRGTDFEQKSSLSATGLTNIIGQLRGIVRDQSIASLAPRLSSAGKLLANANDYVEYLEAFKQEAIEQLKEVKKRVIDLEGRVDPVESSGQLQIEAIYEQLEQLLSHAKGSVE